MKRILQLADLHIDENAKLGGEARTDSAGKNLAMQDLDRAVRAMVEAAHPLDGIVIAGDLFDHCRPTPNEQDFATRLLVDLATRCTANRVLLIPGNHDMPRNPGDKSACRYLLRDPSVLLVDDNPAVVEYAGLQFACLPYPRRSAMREYLGRDVEGAEVETLSGLLTTLAIGMRIEGAQVLVAHAAIGGATVGFRPRIIEGDIEIGREALNAFPVVMLGHIHQQQNHGSATYSGSPTIQDFGEEGERKGGYLWSLDDSGAVITSEPVHAPGRTWKTIDLIRGSFESYYDLSDIAEDVVYRVRGDLPLDVLTHVRETLEIAKANGAYVQDELRVEVENRARDAEIGKCIDETEVLTRALVSRGTTQDDLPRLIAEHKHVQQGV